MTPNWHYWLPQFAMLAVLCIGATAGATGFVSTTVGLVIIAIGAGFDLGFSFAHEFGTGRNA